MSDFSRATLSPAAAEQLEELSATLLPSVSLQVDEHAATLSPSDSEFLDEPETISRSPYTARLLGASDEELVSRDFFRLVEAIRWLVDAEEGGALARRAGIFSSKGELIWARSFAQKDEQRERVMKYNALRILVQVDE